MTLVWFVVWLIANNVGGNEPLAADPVNAWAATLVLAVALDLNYAAGAPGPSRSPPTGRESRSNRSGPRPAPPRDSALGIR